MCGCLIDTLKDVVVIPTGAVQRGPNGTFVYVVKDDNTAAMRPIKVAKQDEIQAVVGSGVTPPERVVTTGFARLTDGSQVSIATGNGAPAPAARPPGSRRRNGAAGAVGSGNRAPKQQGGESAAPAQRSRLRRNDIAFRKPARTDRGIAASSASPLPSGHESHLKGDQRCRSLLPLPRSGGEGGVAKAQRRRRVAWGAAWSSMRAQKYPHPNPSPHSLANGGRGAVRPCAPTERSCAI